MTDTPLRDFLLASHDPIPSGPGAGPLKAEFAHTLRQRCHRAFARFQWFVLALYTVPAADAFRREPGWGVAAAWLLLLLLAIFGPAIAARRAARRPLRAQVRLVGQVEALVLVTPAAMLPILAMALVGRAAAIELPTIGWSLAICLVSVPALALLFRRVARGLARRFDPEWWE
ncbi:MAG TPA: hypothetical protein VF384_10885 [Planctomycetota bacterium]